MLAQLQTANLTKLSCFDPIEEFNRPLSSIIRGLKEGNWQLHLAAFNKNKCYHIYFRMTIQTMPDGCKMINGNVTSSR